MQGYPYVYPLGLPYLPFDPIPRAQYRQQLACAAGSPLDCARETARWYGVLQYNPNPQVWQGAWQLVGGRWTYVSPGVLYGPPGAPGCLR